MKGVVFIKKLIPLIMVVVLVLSGCGSPQKSEFSRSGDKDYFQYAGLEWGCTKDEAKKALKLKDADISAIPRSDNLNEGFAYKTTVLGNEATVSLLFMDEESHSLPVPLGLTGINIDFSCEDGNAAYALLCEQIAHEDNYDFGPVGNNINQYKAELQSEETLESCLDEAKLQKAKDILAKNFPNADKNSRARQGLTTAEPLSTLTLNYNVESKEMRIFIQAVPVATMNNI